MCAGVLGALLLTGCATTPSVPLEPVKLENIYTIDNLKQDQIYDGVRQWFATAFKSSKSVIQYEDKKQEQLLVRQIHHIFVVVLLNAYSERLMMS